MGNRYKRYIREGESLPTQKRVGWNCVGPWRKALERNTRGIWHGCWHPLIFGRAAERGGQVTGLVARDDSIATEDMKA